MTTTSKTTHTMVLFVWASLGLVLVSSSVSASPLLQPQAGSQASMKLTEESKIYNGSDATAKYPFLATLLATIPQEDYYDPLCGGSLIDSTHVLTAAHCFPKIFDLMRAGHKFEIWLAATKISETANVYQQKFNIPKENILIHSEFDKTKNQENDIAIVTLPEPAKLSDEITTICLGEMDPEGLDVELVGFGLTDCRNAAPTLQHASGKSMNAANCAKKLGASLPYHVCYFLHNDKNGYSSQANGDSGGPVFTVRTQEPRYAQIGVVSFSSKYENNCPMKSYPSTSSIPSKFKDFIEKEGKAKPTYCN